MTNEDIEKIELKYLEKFYYFLKFCHIPIKDSNVIVSLRIDDKFECI